MNANTRRNFSDHNDHRNKYDRSQNGDVEFEEKKSYNNNDTRNDNKSEKRVLENGEESISIGIDLINMKNNHDGNRSKTCDELINGGKDEGDRDDKPVVSSWLDKLNKKAGNKNTDNNNNNNKVRGGYRDYKQNDDVRGSSSYNGNNNRGRYNNNNNNRYNKDDGKSDDEKGENNYNKNNNNNNNRGYGNRGGGDSRGDNNNNGHYNNRGDYGNRGNDYRGDYGNRGNDNRGDYGNRGNDNKGDYGNRGNGNRGGYVNRGNNNRNDYGNRDNDNRGGYGNREENNNRDNGNNRGSYGNRVNNNRGDDNIRGGYGNRKDDDNINGDDNRNSYNNNGRNNNRSGDNKNRSDDDNRRGYGNRTGDNNNNGRINNNSRYNNRGGYVDRGDNNKNENGTKEGGECKDEDDNKKQIEDKNSRNRYGNTGRYGPNDEGQRKQSDDVRNDDEDSKTFNNRRNHENEGRGNRSRNSGRSDGSENNDSPRVPKVTYIPDEEEEHEKLLMTHQKGVNFERFSNCKVVVSGKGKPQKCYESFADANLPPQVLDNIKKMGYIVPTPVQKWTMPAIDMGRDVMACAETGSGKTAAFILPILSKLLSEPLPHSSHPKPSALIISPTRELALQISREVKKFANGTAVKSACLYGGVSIQHQNKLIQGSHILVVTVGRLCDFLRNQRLDLSALQFLVLDEADRMLGDGFFNSIESIVDASGGKHCSKRQTIFFSATFPFLVQQLSYDILNDYIFITVGILGQANRDIQQEIRMVEYRDKKEVLTQLLSEIGEKKVMVFLNRKVTADSLCISLSEILQMPMTTLHGDLVQCERERVMSLFRGSGAQVLMATSVAARGLDIQGVDCVINYDLPKNIDEYVHRIGRTARCGHIGKAIAFFNPRDDFELAKPLVTILADTEQEVPDWLEELAKSKSGLVGRNYNQRDARRNKNFHSDRPNHQNSEAVLSKLIEDKAAKNDEVEEEEEEEEDWE